MSAGRDARRKVGEPFFLLKLGFVLWAVTSYCYAAEPGTTASNFLKIGLGARSIGMGEAYVAVVDDVASMSWNPAGLVRLRQQELSFLHTRWLEEIRYHHLSYGYPTPTWGIFGGSLHYLDMGDIQGYEANGAKADRKMATDLAISFGYGRNIMEGFDLGIDLKWIRESLAGIRATAFAIDVGAMYEIFRPHLRFGISLQNLGDQMTFEQKNGTFPFVRRLGTAYYFEPFGKRAVLSVEGVSASDQGTSINLGGEYWINKFFALRVGYKGEHDLGSGLSMGMGIKAHVYQVDYSFSDQGIFGATHRLGITMKFGKQIGETFEERLHFRRGIHLLEQGRYPEAILEFNKVLEINPDHLWALEMMKKANRAMKEGTRLPSPLTPHPHSFVVERSVLGFKTRGEDFEQGVEDRGFRHAPRSSSREAIPRPSVTSLAEGGPTVPVQNSPREVSATRHKRFLTTSGVSSTDVSRAYAFPVPFRSSRGDTFMTFTNLPIQCEIAIYTISGELVRKIHHDDATSLTPGQEKWDLKTPGGEAIFSGVYLYRITSGSDHAQGQLIVVR